MLAAAVDVLFLFSECALLSHPRVCVCILCVQLCVLSGTNPALSKQICEGELHQLRLE